MQFIHLTNDAGDEPIPVCACAPTGGVRRWGGANVGCAGPGDDDQTPIGDPDMDDDDEDDDDDDEEDDDEGDTVWAGGARSSFR